MEVFTRFQVHLTRQWSLIYFDAIALSTSTPKNIIYPNKLIFFSEELSIAVTLQEKDSVSLGLLDLAGRVVRTLQHPMKKTAGIYRQVMKKEALHQCVYYIILKVGTRYNTQKVMVIVADLQNSR